jgi:putative tricarboxylic transport membrane protein
VEIPFGPIIMGFILGPIVELYLRRAVMISEGSLLPFITRPIPAVALGIAVLLLAFSAFRTIKTRK